MNSASLPPGYVAPVQNSRPTAAVHPNPNVVHASNPSEHAHAAAINILNGHLNDSAQELHRLRAENAALQNDKFFLQNQVTKLEDQCARWQGENISLWQDNIRLSQCLNLPGEVPVDYAGRVKLLEDKLMAVIEEGKILLEKHKVTVTWLNLPSEDRLQKLWNDYNALLASHDVVYRKMIHYKEVLDDGVRKGVCRFIPASNQNQRPQYLHAVPSPSLTVHPQPHSLTSPPQTGYAHAVPPHVSPLHAQPQHSTAAPHYTHTADSNPQPPVNRTNHPPNNEQISPPIRPQLPSPRYPDQHPMPALHQIDTNPRIYPPQIQSAQMSQLPTPHSPDNRHQYDQNLQQQRPVHGWSPEQKKTEQKTFIAPLTPPRSHKSMSPEESLPVAVKRGDSPVSFQQGPAMASPQKNENGIHASPDAAMESVPRLKRPSLSEPHEDESPKRQRLDSVDSGIQFLGEKKSGGDVQGASSETIPFSDKNVVVEARRPDIPQPADTVIENAQPAVVIENTPPKQQQTDQAQKEETDLDDEPQRGPDGLYKEMDVVDWLLVGTAEDEDYGEDGIKICVLCRFVKTSTQP
ncbi:hypothetical protein VKT23_001817 [Stygiomarasmius scandens]|uniref:Uncharacterized protein n=1 Tax=Marasmiellus scandens TaxID=2682957 RepID=A0ABR1K3R5_9AGAR